MRHWKTAYASVIGTSHMRLGMPCQDASLSRVVQTIDGSEVLFAVASDGASSAWHAEAGAKLAVLSFFEEFGLRAANDSGLITFTRGAIESWIRRFQHEVAERSRMANMEMREFSCTFLAAIAGPRSAVCVQVGDGAIIGLTGAITDDVWITWPQKGKSRNSTFFLTGDDVFERTVVNVVPQPLQEVAVFTDGLENLFLDPCARTVRFRVLQPIFETVRGHEPASDGGQSPEIVNLLTSNIVNKSTDDDKSLVIATRLASCVR